jgi:ubiquinone/menaquinone biosynthesis C-methylase UbiE
MIKEDKGNMKDKDSIEVVGRAYTEFAERMKNWPNKYDIGRQTSKLLSDYALLSRIDLRGKKVLNVGISEPDDEVYFANIAKEWHALDINEEIILAASKLASEALPPHLYAKLKFIVGDATALDFDDESYDVVVSFSTIDHIPGEENRKKAIDEMCRVLKRGGHLIVTVPNKWDVIYSHHSNKLQREGKAIFGYEYQFSPLELRKMIISNGLEILDFASTSFNPLSYFDQLLRKLKLHKLKIYFGTRLGFLARKPEY